METDTCVGAHTCLCMVSTCAWRFDKWQAMRVNVLIFVLIGTLK